MTTQIKAYLKQIEDNLGAARGRLPDATLRQTMARYFDAIADN